MTDETTDESHEQQGSDADQFVHDSSREAFENMYTRLDWQDQMTLQMVFGEPGDEEPIPPLEELRGITKRLERSDATGQDLSWFQQSNGVFHAYLEIGDKMSWVGEMIPDEDRGMVWRPKGDLLVPLEGDVYASFRERLQRLPIRTEPSASESPEAKLSLPAPGLQTTGLQRRR